ncbi:hypothetical protein [Streptomyces lateritius]|uniref:hypothetical protein n=1 Tax=Streptomyces lateritius TaxID=67313 RepID=UPI001676C626|nr:hypothetical protein [Streptomyces lateritius]
MTPATEDPELATPAPLWGTDELPVSAYAAGEGGLDERPEADVGDLLSNFQDFQAAWDDAVTTGGTSAELIDDVRADSGLPGHRR